VHPAHLGAKRLARGLSSDILALNALGFSRKFVPRDVMSATIATVRQQLVDLMIRRMDHEESKGMDFFSK
jgi:hypothetical protein